MKENLKQTNIGNITKIAATAVIGAGLLVSARSLATEIRANDINNCALITEMTRGCLSIPPKPDQSDTITRSFNDKYIEMDETLKWNPETSRWQIIDRKWEAIPRERKKLQFLDNIDAKYAANDMSRREEFFAQPTSNTECKTGVWDDSNWSYTYCWDQKSNSWQESGEGPIYNTFR